MIARSACRGSTTAVPESFPGFGSTVVDVAVAVFDMTETGPKPDAGSSTDMVIVSVSVPPADTVPSAQLPAA